ncbi:hypothetical protein G9409_08205 [Chlorobium sp. BLA1]|uniref:terminase large subunit domain-containing protein n=1 Tax=Candidatus Chlorobium masyuteum TaxID=2716876 RepID=UPI0014218468|nr:terminase family protein [Candidatus Chlorobium masyuteum]NHQ60568.1 hypothetical protein [Candidatus Chlorobium masyuteum]
MKFVIDKRRMLQHQREFWELPNFIKLLVGGYGCGKTRIGALRSIWCSYINAPVPHLYVSPSYKQARKTVIISISELLDAAGARYTYHKTNHEFFIKNWNGNIWIGSGDHPDSLKGPNLGSAGIDEPFLMKEVVFDNVLSRLRHPAAKHRELFLTGTPEQLNWGYDVARNLDGQYDLGVVVGRTADNVHLPTQFVTMLEKAFDEQQRRAYMNGEFLNLTAGRVYKYFDRLRHCGGRTVPEGCEIMAGIDFNVDYMTAVVFTVLDERHIHCFYEIRLQDASTYDLADVLYERYPGITVFPDPAGRARKSSSDKTDFTILKDKGFNVVARPAHPPVKSRVNAVNKLLREGLLTVENCPCLVRDLEQVAWKNGEIDKLTRPELTHASDAIGYPVEKLFPVRLPQRSYKGQPEHWRV